MTLTPEVLAEWKRITERAQAADQPIFQKEPWAIEAQSDLIAVARTALPQAISAIERLTEARDSWMASSGSKEDIIATLLAREAELRKALERIRDEGDTDSLISRSVRKVLATFHRGEQS